MNKPIYFSKIEFREQVAHRLNSNLLIDLDEGALAYQVYDSSPRDKAPAITRIEHEEVLGEIRSYKMGKPGMRMKNFHTGFEYTMLVDDECEEEVIFSYIHRFCETEKRELLPYCNALDFEPYRDRGISPDDKGYSGYKDDVDVTFIGITDSYIPMIKLPLDRYCDEDCIVPCVELYFYILRKYLNGKKLREWVKLYMCGSR